MVESYVGLPAGAELIDDTPTAIPTPPDMAAAHPSTLPLPTQLAPSHAPTPEPIASLPSRPKGYTNRVKDDISTRWAKIVEMGGREEPLPGVPINATNMAIRGAGMALAPVSEALVSLWRALPADEAINFATNKAQRAGENLYDTVFEIDPLSAQKAENLTTWFTDKSGQVALKALLGGAEGIEYLRRTRPEIAETFESLIDIPLLKLEGMLAKEAALTLKDTAKVLGRVANPTREGREITMEIAGRKLSNTIRNTLAGTANLFKSPGTSSPAARSALDRMEKGILDIVDNRETFSLQDLNYKPQLNKLPTNPETAVFDLFQNIEQSKTRLQPAIEKSSDSPANLRQRVSDTIPIQAIEDELKKKALPGTGELKDWRKAANVIIAEYKEKGPLSLREAHGIVKRKNAKSIIDTNFEVGKKELREAGEKAVREEFLSLLDKSGNDVLSQYGNFLALDENIVDLLSTKAANKGLTYSKAYTAIEALKFVATGHFNPSALGIWHGANDLIKANKAVGKQISQMFESALKVADQKQLLSNPLAPQSILGQKTFALLQNGAKVTQKGIIFSGATKNKLISLFKSEDLSAPLRLADDVLQRASTAPEAAQVFMSSPLTQAMKVAERRADAFGVLSSPERAPVASATLAQRIASFEEAVTGRPSTAAESAEALTKGAKTPAMVAAERRARATEAFSPGGVRANPATRR